ncbi:MAG: DNA-binding domain-containing protein [Sulfitobacter sp.]
METDFRNGLLDPGAPAPSGLRDGSQGPPGKRYDVYRNNVTHSLIEALGTAFPLVRKLIGERHFANLAPLYVRAHPPTSPLMMFYGAEFPEFISGFAPLSEIGYLADAARLDLAMRQSYHAGDVRLLTAEDLQTIAPDALAGATFSLAPATAILRSHWPLFDIWRFNFEEGAPKPRAIAQDVLITRPAFDPTPHRLPVGGADWLLALAEWQSFAAATTTAEAAHPDFELECVLRLVLREGAIMNDPPRN